MATMALMLFLVLNIWAAYDDYVKGQYILMGFNSFTAGFIASALINMWIERLVLGRD